MAKINYVITLIFFTVVTFAQCFSQSDENELILYDTTFMFEGDMKVQMIKHNKTKTIYIYKSDGNLLLKKYSDLSDILLRSEMRDKEGYMHGRFYAYNPLEGSRTYGEFIHGALIFSYTLNEDLDTIGYTKKINDTLFQKMRIQGDTIIKYEMNELNNRNGLYQEIDKKTKTNLVRGNYKSYSEAMVKNKDLLSERADKYEVPFIFWGITNYLEVSVPVGIWYFYSKDGTLIKTIEYDWSGVFEAK